MPVAGIELVGLCVAYQFRTPILAPPMLMYRHEWNRDFSTNHSNKCTVTVGFSGTDRAVLRAATCFDDRYANFIDYLEYRNL